MKSKEKGEMMFLEKAKLAGKAAVLGASMLGISACVEYTIETTLHSDGGGFRSERMEVTKNDDLSLSPEAFGELMLVTEDQGWVHTLEVDSKADTTNIFERRTPIAGFGSWSDLNDGVYIAGAFPSQANTKVGYVSLGDVEFRNTVEVKTGAVTDGSTSFTYREAFYFEDAVDVIVEMFMSILSEALADKYPLLSDHQRGEIVGLARAYLWTAFDEGLLDDWEERFLNRAADRTTEKALNILRLQYPQESQFFLRDFLQKLYQGDGEVGKEVDAFIENRLPGLNLAFNVAIQIRLNMPGKVMNSNHHQVDGSTLVWEFEPMDAAGTPVEIFAESVVGG